MLIIPHEKYKRDFQMQMLYTENYMGSLRESGQCKSTRLMATLNNR